MDLATANFENSTMSILFGNGDGTFDAPVNYPSGLYPNDIATDDFNDDGNADVVIANQGGHSVTIYLGNANGIFSDSSNYSVGQYVDAVTVADVNNDSIPDLLTANESSSDISALIGNGDGTFQPALNSPAPGGIASIAVADFNNDGWKDVVYCHILGFNEVIHYFCIQFGDGTGMFSNEVQIDSVRYPIDAIGADVNNDGFADVITADFFADTASVYYGIGDGTFDPAVGYGAYIEPDAIVMADMNKDNIPDILAADYGSNGIAVLPGHGDGTFGAYVQDLCVVDPQSLTVDDFNEDGLPDIASGTTYFGSAYYAIILNCTVTGIDIDPNENSIVIFPNPVSESLTIRLAGTTDHTTITIANVLGQSVFSKRVSHSGESILVNTSEWSSGIYFITLQTGTSGSTQKIYKAY